MNTSKKVDSKGLDSLAVKLKVNNLAEWSVGDLKSLLTEMKLKVAGTKKDLLNRLFLFANDNNLLEKRLKEVKKIYVFKHVWIQLKYLHHHLYGVRTNRFFPR